MKKIGMILCIAIMAASVAGCQKGERSPEKYAYTEEDGMVYTEAGRVRVYIDKQYLKWNAEQDLAVYRLKEAAEKAADFLKTEQQVEPYVCRILGGDGLTGIKAGELNIYYYQTVEQPYVDWMIQLLAGVDVPDWLREGLGAYGAQVSAESLLNSYGKNLTALDGLRTAPGASLQEMAQCLYDAGGQELAMGLGDLLEGLSEQTSGEEAELFRGAYCIYAGSFVEYLTEEYGLDVVMQVYAGADFEEAMGNTWDACWQLWVQNVLAE